MKQVAEDSGVPKHLYCDMAMTARKTIENAQSCLIKAAKRLFKLHDNEKLKTNKIGERELLAINVLHSVGVLIKPSFTST